MNSQFPRLEPQPSVELHIDELVLDGFSPSDRFAISDAIERGLAQVLHEQDVPTSLRAENARDEIKGATFNATHEASPPIIGRQIAAAIYEGIGK